jgi:pimeloyl-ACP methyl ester carboxylesterase
MFSLRRLLATHVYVPFVPIPEGRMVELPGRGGATYVTDTPGPSPDSPTVVLLHSLACTSLLTWFPSIPRLIERYRVVTLDLRWHGRGIQSEHFTLPDCADDVVALMDVLGVDEAIMAGYSMGGVVAQRLWRQHPSRVSGLVLASTSDRFQRTLAEHAFFGSMGLSMGALRGLAHSRTVVRAGKAAARAASVEPNDLEEWALDEFRSTSPWAVAEALAALGRHHSRPWLGRIDVPTAVVISARDRVIPPARQLGLARAIPGATIHDIPTGHAGCVLESEVFVPAFVEAVHTVRARGRDFRRTTV